MIVVSSSRGAVRRKAVVQSRAHRAGGVVGRGARTVGLRRAELRASRKGGRR